MAMGFRSGLSLARVSNQVLWHESRLRDWIYSNIPLHLNGGIFCHPTCNYLACRVDGVVDQPRSRERLDAARQDLMCLVRKMTNRLVTKLKKVPASTPQKSASSLKRSGSHNSMVVK